MLVADLIKKGVFGQDENTWRAWLKQTLTSKVYEEVTDQRGIAAIFTIEEIFDSSFLINTVTAAASLGDNKTLNGDWDLAMDILNELLAMNTSESHYCLLRIKQELSIWLNYLPALRERLKDGQNISRSHAKYGPNIFFALKAYLKLAVYAADMEVIAEIFMLAQESYLTQTFGEYAIYEELLDESLIAIKQTSAPIQEKIVQDALNRWELVVETTNTGFLNEEMRSELNHVILYCVTVFSTILEMDANSWNKVLGILKKLLLGVDCFNTKYLGKTGTYYGMGWRLLAALSRRELPEETAASLKQITLIFADLYIKLGKLSEAVFVLEPLIGKLNFSDVSLNHAITLANNDKFKWLSEILIKDNDDDDGSSVN